MSKFVRISDSTRFFLEFAIYHLEDIQHRQLLRRQHRHFFLGYKDGPIELDSLRSLILELNEASTKQEMPRQGYPLLSKLEVENWLLYEDDLEIIPLYKEAISVSAFSYIIEPERIPNLLAFVRIPRTRNAVDPENHSFGYHFHYGKIKSGALKRSNILFTFNPNNESSKNSKRPILYSEYHGEGHSVAFDVDTIGINKRKPIYLVCHDEAQKRGLTNFKRLKKEARAFYPLQEGNQHP